MPGSSGVMQVSDFWSLLKINLITAANIDYSVCFFTFDDQTMGRDMRLKYAASFETCYSFRLLYYAGSFYPIMGALRYI